MTYLNWDVLDALDEAAFREAKPYPWMNPTGTLTEEGRKALLAELPDFNLFQKTFGMERSYGQKPHDRWQLRYVKGLALPTPWREFIAELQGRRYRAFVARMFGRTDFVIRHEWLYASRGCAVSPHCDGRGKIGSQLFYLNDENDWSPSWGGATLVLDDEGKMDYASAPEFDDFPREIAAEAIGNHSFIFARTDHAWHGMRPLTCPEGKMRRLFTAVVDKRVPLSVQIKGMFKKLLSRP